MKYLIKKILNRIYLFDLKIHRSQFSLLFVIVPVLISLIFLYFINLIVGISLFVFISLYIVSVRHLKLDLSIYDIPKEGDKIIFTKNYSERSPYHKYKRDLHIEKGSEFSVCSIHITDSNTPILRILKNGEIKPIDIFYFDCKNYFKTKSKIRDDIITKILS